MHVCNIVNINVIIQIVVAYLVEVSADDCVEDTLAVRPIHHEKRRHLQRRLFHSPHNREEVVLRIAILDMNIIILLLDYLVILSIHNYTPIYCHSCYVIIIIILTVSTYTKLFIINNNYTYTVIYQYHCNVIIH